MPRLCERSPESRRVGTDSGKRSCRLLATKDETKDTVTGLTHLPDRLVQVFLRVEQLELVLLQRPGQATSVLVQAERDFMVLLRLADERKALSPPERDALQLLLAVRRPRVLTREPSTSDPGSASPRAVANAHLHLRSVDVHVRCSLTRRERRLELGRILCSVTRFLFRVFAHVGLSSQRNRMSHKFELGGSKRNAHQWRA